MTAITAANVVFTADNGSRNIQGNKNIRQVTGTLVFGNGALTYPTGGVPLPVPALGVGGMGLGRKLARLFILDDSGYAGMIKWDSTNNTLRMFYTTVQTASSGSRIGAELANGDTIPSNVTVKVRCEGI